MSFKGKYFSQACWTGGWEAASYLLLHIVAWCKDLINFIIYFYANTLTLFINRFVVFFFFFAFIFKHRLRAQPCFFPSTFPVLWCSGPRLQKYPPELNFCSDSFSSISAQSLQGTRAVRRTRCSFSTGSSSGICFLGCKRRCYSLTSLLYGGYICWRATSW